jgi:hypothetical protein
VRGESLGMQAVDTAAAKVASFGRDARAASGARDAPSGPQIERPKPPNVKNGRDVSPWLVVGAALAAGYVLAKIVDWRGHAHPRL